jgi:PleD family two-component response regulator
VGRFGGDEFMIACADQPIEATAALAEAIRAGVVKAAAQHEPPLAGLSLSIASRRPAKRSLPQRDAVPPRRHRALRGEERRPEPRRRCR